MILAVAFLDIKKEVFIEHTIQLPSNFKELTPDELKKKYLNGLLDAAFTEVKIA